MVINSNLLPEGFIEHQMETPTAEKRFGEPEDTAMVVAWLAREESKWIMGHPY